MTTKAFKKVIAREGLISLGVLFLSASLLFIAKEIMWQERVIFNYECTYNGETQKIGIVSVSRAVPLKNALWGGFVKKSSQTFTAQEKDWADVNIFRDRFGGHPPNFIVKNLPREFSENAMLKIVILNFGIGIPLAYLLYCLTRYCLWAKKIKQATNMSRISLIFVEEGKVIAQSVFLWILLLIGSFVLTAPEIVVPPQGSMILQTASEGLFLLPIAYITIQLIRFIVWSLRTLSGT
jgi:hypothetical protein